MNPIERRTFLKTVGTAAAGVALMSGPRVVAANAAKAKRSKAELVRLFTGVHNFHTTPFTADYSLNAEGLRRNIADHALVPTKDTTMVVSGGLGELSTLTVAEHKSVVQAAVAGAQNKYPVIAGVGNGYANAIAMARNAQAAGVDGVFVFTSPYACNDAEGAYEYVKDVANSIQIGVMVYTCSKSDFWPEVLPRLAKLPNVMGFKDGSGDVEVGKALGSLVGDDFLWIGESEGHSAKVMLAGGRAYTTAVAVFVPEACHDFWKYGTAGDAARMDEVQKTRLDPILKLRDVQPGYGVSGIKVGLEALGRDGGPMRPPGTQVKKQDRATISDIARKHSEPSVWRAAK